MALGLTGRSLGAATLAVLLSTSLARAESGVTKERARLRQGPSATTELLQELNAGVRLQLLGESDGWRQVRTPDGRIGYVWAEHLIRDAEPKPAPAEARKPEPTTAPARSLADEVHDLRDELAALRQRPEPATTADLDRLRQQIDRLASAERDVARRLDEHVLPTAPASDPPPDGPGSLAPALLAIGGFLGFVASRLLQRRAERRQRNRLRL